MLAQKSENLLSARGQVRTKDYTIDWRGDDPLRYDSETGVIRRTNDAVVMGRGGYMPTPLRQWSHVRLALTTAPTLGTGAFAFIVLDVISGMSVACRRLNTARVVESKGERVLEISYTPSEVDDDASTAPQRGWYDHGYSPYFTVAFGRMTYTGSYLQVRDQLREGEVVLDVRRPKSLVRRVRRFREAGAVDIGHDMLMLTSTAPSAWPPPARERKPRPCSGDGVWNKRNANRPRHY